MAWFSNASLRLSTRHSGVVAACCATLLATGLFFSSIDGHPDSDTALLEIRPDTSVAELIRGLSSGNAFTRTKAIEELYRRAEMQYDPFGDFSFDFNNDDAINNRELFRAELEKHLSDLQKLARIGNEKSRASLIWIIGSLGPTAQPVIPDLKGVLRSRNASFELRYAAAIAILHVTPLDEQIGPQLIQMYNEEAASQVISTDDNLMIAGSEIGSVLLARVLASSGRSAVEVPFLTELTASRYPRNLRLMALLTVINLEEEARSAIPNMRKLLHDDDPLIRSNAGLALLLIQHSPEEMPEILKNLQLSNDDLTEFREIVARTVQEWEREIEYIRGDAVRIVRKCEQALKHPNPFIQRTALRILGRIGHASISAVPAIIVAAKDKAGETRIAALRALERIDSSQVPAGMHHESE